MFETCHNDRRQTAAIAFERRCAEEAARHGISPLQARKKLQARAMLQKRLATNRAA